uniref:Vacuolar iron transporter n=1 Tax=Quercus lobata TaxID=97700 RepID=A0A7N2L309_QUELO
MGYDVVPTEAPNANMSSDESELLMFNEKKKKRCRFFSKKSFWICCPNVEFVKGAHQEKERAKEKKVGFKHKKKNVLMCCSNMELETEEEKEQVGLMILIGAVIKEKTMIFNGVAGLVAGACSMVVGEFVSVHSQYYIEKAQMKRECSIENMGV